MQPLPMVQPVMPADFIERLEGLGTLDKIHAGFAEAARLLSQQAGISLCVDKCGRCCETVTNLLVYGIEAEFLVGYLVGQPGRPIANVKARCYEWLTRREPGLTYKLKPSQTIEDLNDEFRMLVAPGTRPCVMLDESTKRCTIHGGRPMVCRAYSVTHMPNDWCLRPRSPLEPDANHRISWNGAPIRRVVDDMIAGFQMPMHKRLAFLPLLVYELIDPKGLAGLIADGRIPLAKQLGAEGGDFMLLWHDQDNAPWSQVVDAAIADHTLVMVDRDGQEVQQVKV